MLEDLQQAWASYKQLFGATVHLSLKRGFKDYGQEGQMRLYAHALEKEPLPKAQLLMLRRHEKDYIIRKDTVYARQFFKLLNTIRAQHPLTPHLTDLMNQYESGFRQLIQTDARLGLTSYTGLRGEVYQLTQTVE